MKDEETQVALFGTTSLDTIDTDALARVMDDTAEEGGRAGDISYMSFSGKRDRYQIGVDKREPGEEEPFLVSVMDFELGYICWKDGKPVSKRMANIRSPKVPEPDPEEFGPFTRDTDGWQKARAITARSLENSEQVYFSINSKSGVASMSDLQRAVRDRMKAGQPFWPVIYFGSEDFEAQGNINAKPVFEVVRWCETEEVMAIAQPDADPMSLLEKEAPKKAPAPRKRRL